MVLIYLPINDPSQVRKTSPFVLEPIRTSGLLIILSAMKPVHMVRAPASTIIMGYAETSFQFFQPGDVMTVRRPEIWALQQQAIKDFRKDEIPESAFLLAQ
jgi:hypothetical protein